MTCNRILSAGLLNSLLWRALNNLMACMVKKKLKKKTAFLFFQKKKEWGTHLLLYSKLWASKLRIYLRAMWSYFFITFIIWFKKVLWPFHASAHLERFWSTHRFISQQRFFLKKREVVVFKQDRVWIHDEFKEKSLVLNYWYISTF